MTELVSAKDLQEFHTGYEASAHVGANGEALLIVNLIERVNRAETALAAANERIAQLQKIIDESKIDAQGFSEETVTMIRENEQLKASMEGN